MAVTPLKSPLSPRGYVAASDWRVSLPPPPRPPTRYPMMANKGSPFRSLAQFKNYETLSTRSSKRPFGNASISRRKSSRPPRQCFLILIGAPHEIAAPGSVPFPGGAEIEYRTRVPSVPRAGRFDRVAGAATGHTPPGPGGREVLASQAEPARTGQSGSMGWHIVRGIPFRDIQNWVSCSGLLSGSRECEGPFTHSATGAFSIG